MHKKQQLSQNSPLKKPSIGDEWLFISKVCLLGLGAQGLAEQR